MGCSGIFFTAPPELLDPLGGAEGGADDELELEGAEYDGDEPMELPPEEL
jgi:hypothetical protein